MLVSSGTLQWTSRLPAVPSDVRRLNVLIASPGDATAERDAVERAMHAWNDSRGDAEKIILRPRRWEVGSVPITGRGDAQSVINMQLVDDSDIVIRIFYHRLGTATQRAISGTAEEIQRSVGSGKPVHLYFANKEVPPDVELDQLKALRDFRSQMQASSLVAMFESENDLTDQVIRAIEYDIVELRGPFNTVSANFSAPSATHRSEANSGQVSATPP
jgi:hypothetical protein